MSTAGPSAGQKRKATGQNQNSASASASRKRQKFQDARIIPSQTADAALSKSGELNITAFVKSREYEINALDKSMKKARRTLSSRAFQQVPRHLRRRTASHNAKKVPRRLQVRAKREMIEDNTPTVDAKTRKPNSRLRLRLETAKALKKLTQNRKTVRQKKREAKMNASGSDPAKHVDVVRVPRLKKNRLSNPPMATSKFKRRQISKTWLPTHVWHAKRAHMTKPSEPLWRIAVPLSPTEKSYRSTHRASGSRGCIGWDTSYMSTISCRGTEKALENLLRALGFHGHRWTGPHYSKWKAGSRFASGWTCKRESREALAIVDVFWCALKPQIQLETEKLDTTQCGDVEMGGSTIEAASSNNKRGRKLDQKLMLRLHPSAFHHFWHEVLQIAKMQKPQVLVEDLRFEIGSIELRGPASAEVLAGVLKSIDNNDETHKMWNTLLPLTNPALLPLNVLLSLQVQDPRLYPHAKKSATSKDESAVIALHEFIVNWPLDQNLKPSPLFSQKARFMAGKLPSQWALNRRRNDTLPGQRLQLTPKDPSIPIVLLAHRQLSTNVNNSQNSSQQGSWTLLAPWNCIDTLWRQMLFFPFANGSKPRFGGLQETRQVAFEQSTPWFPGDFPGTQAGKAWDRSETEKRFDAWIKRPPSRRTAWDKIDLGLNRRGELGRGWMCDWEYLIGDSRAAICPGKSTPRLVVEKSEKGNTNDSLLLTQRQRKAAKASAEARKLNEEMRRNTSSPELSEANEDTAAKEQYYSQLTPLQARSILQNHGKANLPSEPALLTIKIKLLTKGTPLDTARIYRLPAVALGPTKQHADGRTISDASLEPVASGSTPPAAQKSPLKPLAEPESQRAGSHPNLRARWLSLVPETKAGHAPIRIQKEKSNHRGLPRQAHHHAAESLRHINVLPKNPPQEIIDQYGPKPMSEEENRICLEKEFQIQMQEQQLWDEHVPCPDADDLIGFVTSGGYNLAEGRGTAIGSLWLQRVVEGWTVQLAERFADRERHLCIVRNSGESVGRIATWELCD